jgi:hypothetical protein
MKLKLVYATGLIVMASGTNPKLAQAQYDSCYMINSSGQTISLGSLCSMPASSSQPASEATFVTPVETGTEPNRGYCEDLPQDSQVECYDNYDRSGNRVGSTIGGSRYGGSGRIIRDGTYDCEYASQYDQTGRICGSRASDDFR